MATSSVLTIGSTVKYRGVYNSSSTYYNGNQVSWYGCLFQVVANKITGIAPLAMTSDGTISFDNTSSWTCIIDNIKLYNATISTNNLESRVTTIEGNISSIEKSVGSAANSAEEAAKSAESVKNAIPEEASARQKADEALQANIDAIKELLGEADGIATLDSNKELQETQLPHRLTNDVLVFNSFDENEAPSVEDNYCADGEIFFLNLYSGFAIYNKSVGWSKNWEGAAFFGDSTDMDIVVPFEGKIYIDASTNTPYYWNGGELVKLFGSLQEAIGAKIDVSLIGEASGVAPLDDNKKIPSKYIPNDFESDIFLTKIVDAASDVPSNTLGVYYAKDTHMVYTVALTNGAITITAESASSGKLYIDKNDNVMYRYDETKGLVAVTSKSAPASIFNATVEVPISGYYVLCDQDNESTSAVHAAWNADKAVSGLIISFEMSAGNWKTYQYIGKTVTEKNWINTDNWKDFGSLAAGSESYIIIDTIVGSPTVGTYYTLATAVQALITYQESSGITYAKKGLIISYKTSENTMETKQFQGEVSDFGEVALWKDFGGSSDIEAVDTPEEGGTDAFSTGGAYANLPTGVNLAIDGSTLSASLSNAAGDQIGETAQVVLPAGGGESSGTIVTIYPKESPFYTKSGGSVILQMAIMSVTTKGNVETTNMIEKIELIDRDTNQVLETLSVNQASSASESTFDFQLDVSSYFVNAGQRRFRIVAYDDQEKSGSRNINVTAVDVTISSVQTLNYTTSTVLNVGGATKSLPMYKFANNSSDKGILTTTEIFLDGKWQVLGTATVMDTYSHSVSIDPMNCLGKALAHGAYPLRIHGVDISAGVVGNYLHTAVMVIDSEDTTPIIATRWLTDEETGTKKLYETISVEFAVYSPTTAEPTAEVYEMGKLASTRVAYRNTTYSYSHKVTDVAYDGSVTIDVIVKCNNSASQTADFLINGTLLDIEEVTTQRQFSIDFSNRSNEENDHSIKDNGISLDLTGINWSSNGFVKDSYGTGASDGNMALRIAEDATGTLHYAPFDDASIETNGLAIQFTLMKKNIANDSVRLIECISGGFGFYLDGSNVVFTFDNTATVAGTITAALDDSERTNVAIVIEPTNIAPYSGIQVAKMYFDGEEIGTCYRSTNSALVPHSNEITFNSAEGDLYLYNIKAWKTYFGFEQEFENYLLTAVNTDAMIEEYEFNQVMSSQTAENTTKNRPQAIPLFNLGIPYFVLCKNADTADNDAKDNYPEYLETLDGDKKTKRTLDIYAYFPDRPWQNFKAIGCSVTNQGTTSSKRPIKNIKIKLKGAIIILLHTEDEFSGEALEKFKICQANAAKNRVQVLDTSLPTNIITVKVDYSESGGANNGASTQLYNDLQRGLGDNYITPAQKAYNGTTNYIINTSICSIPCAFFRTDRYSPDATSPSYGYFHAKGNWNEDKGDAKVFGFEDVKGYNADCLNYGDFIELVANRDETLSAFAARVDKSAWISVDDEGNENVYVLSEFCGNGHKVYRYKDGTWTETTGNMTYTNGKWVVTGDVVNPVENYELLKYDALDWFQGVNSLDDMLETDTEGKPIWLQYFESRYPDDDNLNELYESGKKVPYNLYKWLRFCQDCNHHLTAADGNITINGVSVSGTPENRLKKWKQELHTAANVYSILCYHIFTDYIAAVDQRSKNMMIGFYLETDGFTKMYLNHLYDGDTINGSDNDCGLTVPVLVDPNNDNEGVYQGHDSVLFVQNAAVGTDGFWLNDSGSNTLTMRAVADAMRNYTTSDGLKPFSYAGLVKYFITDRLQKWPKLVSSFDGERKYIENSKSTANYMYALHGLSIQRLKDFIKTRFLFRDGFYATGDMLSSSVSFRATGTDIKIKIRAAKAGYFGVGVDRAASVTDSAYLEAGEEKTLETGMTNTGSGTMLYIFGADKLEMLDISEATPNNTWDITELNLIKELIIGGTDHVQTNNTGGYLSQLDLGNLPYLESVDVRNTAITTIEAEYCPRLKKVLASGSQLTRVTLAEQGKIETLELPSTYKNLTLRYQSNIKTSGITLANPASVETLVIEDCANVDAWKVLADCGTTEGSSLTYVRVTKVEVRGDGTDLNALMLLELKGIDSTLSATDKVVLTGEYQLTTYTEDSLIATWQSTFPDLAIEQQAYSDYKEYDNETDSQNVTNLDNKTGYDYDNDYVASGHILKIRSKSVPVYGKLNSDGKFHMEKMSETNYAQLPDGTEFDNTDSLGEMYDCFMFIPHFWYKGINDFRKQEKHTLISSNRAKPKATYKILRQPLLSECLYADQSAIPVANISIGSTFSDTALATLTSCAVYKMDVSGCKQARYIGMNNASYCAITTDVNGVVLSTETMAITAISGSPLDFSNANGDYVFCNIPDGAAYLYFTCLRSFDDTHIILSTDSDDIEAIEPEWVEHKAELIGIYSMTIDDIGMARSVSGRVTQRGTGTSTTNTGWIYDSEGNPTNIPSGTINYTSQDLLNVCRYRGVGYHSISYEASKIITILSRCYYGNKDDQRIYGFGYWNSGYTTGMKDSIGKADTKYSENGINKIWGLEGFVGCMWEIMDNIGVNINTFAAWKANKRPDNDNTLPIDHKWRIYDSNNKTERVVQGLNITNYNIMRVKHGRYCDIIASSFSTDRSSYSTGYAAEQQYSQLRGRCVHRACYSTSAHGGLVYAYASSASSSSNSDYGARLAFDGELENENEIDEDA